MSDNEQELIEIYLDGSVISYDAQGDVSIKMQADFLDKLTGYFDRSDGKRQMFYMLNREQWVQFTDFRLGKPQ
jgi:hypothetical protein